MNIVVGMVVAGAVGLVAWAAAPWVSMRRRGTVDARTLAACRAECAIPAPRSAPDDVAWRVRSIGTTEAG